MRLTAINQFYWPDLVATSQLLQDLCEHLAARGHEVHVVAGRSNSTGGDVQLPLEEVHHGVHIHRVPAWDGGRDALWKRGLGFASFNAAALARTLSLPKPDAVLCLSTPPLVASLGLLMRAMTGTRLVYWVQDLYPDLAVALGALEETGPVAMGAALVGAQLLAHSDAVVALGSCMQDALVARGAAPSHVHVVDNWADGGSVVPRPVLGHPLRAAWHNQDSMCVMYSGNLGLAHDVDTLLGAVRVLGRDPRFSFMFVGEGQKRRAVMEAATNERLAQVSFHPLVPREQLGESLTAADVHLISLMEPLAGMVVPSKLYGIMAAGRPSIFVGPRNSHVWRVLEQTGAGMCVENGNVAGLLGALERLAGNPALRTEMGQRARAAFEERFGKDKALQAWERVLLDVVNS